MIVLRLKAKVLKCLPAGPPPPLRFPEIPAITAHAGHPGAQRSPALPPSGLHSSLSPAAGHAAKLPGRSQGFIAVRSRRISGSRRQAGRQAGRQANRLG